jgi:hypothetical protein
MDAVMLTLKYLLFLAMEAFVVATIAAVFIVGVYQIVKDKILEARRLDEVGLEGTGSTRGTAVRHS